MHPLTWLRSHLEAMYHEASTRFVAAGICMLVGRATGASQAEIEALVKKRQQHLKRVQWWLEVVRQIEAKR